MERQSPRGLLHDPIMATPCEPMPDGLVESCSCMPSSDYTCAQLNYRPSPPLEPTTFFLAFQKKDNSTSKEVINHETEESERREYIYGNALLKEMFIRHSKSSHKKQLNVDIT
ncbi:unnamed protein product [Sphenostylis stenocarpa]|uniref:Uncharacterized protein n=1 Tax=Sphenostylis stenocarpa TaxID=92480 RepID=A0AA86VQG5_9FABA|nr:unnamed protein product [Sphenostylis stenocarpa]